MSSYDYTFCLSDCSNKECFRHETKIPVNTLVSCAYLKNSPTCPMAESWVFTFGCGQAHEGYFVRIYGTFDEARKKMCEKYGQAWCMQYSEEDWQRWLDRKPDWVPVEKELEVII